MNSIEWKLCAFFRRCFFLLLLLLCIYFVCLACIASKIDASFAPLFGTTHILSCEKWSDYEIYSCQKFKKIFNNNITWFTVNGTNKTITGTNIKGESNILLLLWLSSFFFCFLFITKWFDLQIVTLSLLADHLCDTFVYFVSGTDGHNKNMCYTVTVHAQSYLEICFSSLLFLANVCVRFKQSIKRNYSILS